MSGVKKLFGDAALYGLSSILARLLNFLLTPLLTVALTKAEYGINSLLYVAVAFAMVVLTYGMETAFFRQSQRDGADPDRVYSTAMTMLLATTGIFTAVLAWTYSGAARYVNLDDHPEYVLWTGLIIAMDVLAAVPFARLRAQQRAKRFVAIKTAQIGLNLILNYAFFAVLPAQIEGWPALQVGWVLVANLAASGLMMLLLTPQWLEIRPARFDPRTARTLLAYGFPLLLAGLPGVANEMADRFFLEALLPASTATTPNATFGSWPWPRVFLPPSLPWAWSRCWRAFRGSSTLSPTSIGTTCCSCRCCFLPTTSSRSRPRFRCGTN